MQSFGGVTKNASEQILANKMSNVINSSQILSRSEMDNQLEECDETTHRIVKISNGTPVEDQDMCTGGDYVDKVIRIPIIGDEQIMIFIIADDYDILCFIRLNIPWNNSYYLLLDEDDHSLCRTHSEDFLALIQTGYFKFKFTHKELDRIIISSGKLAFVFKREE